MGNPDEEGNEGARTPTLMGAAQADLSEMKKELMHENGQMDCGTADFEPGGSSHRPRRKGKSRKSNRPTAPLCWRSPDEEGAPVYSVSYKGRPILIESRMGLALKEVPGFLQGFKITALQPGSHDETWKPVAAEKSPIRDRYNSLTVNLEGEAGGKLQLVFRAYDEGAGFRYIVPRQDGLKQLTITDEATEFRFEGNYPCWPVYYAQGEYKAGSKSFRT